MRLAGGLRTWTEEALRRFPLQETPLNRFLAATALVYGLTLLTLDERLAGASWLPTRSS